MAGLFLLALAVMSFIAMLGRIFNQEHDDAREAVAKRRRAVEQYAAVELRRAWAERLASAAEALTAARKDPLAESQGLYLSVGGRQAVPIPDEEQDTPARVAEIESSLRGSSAPPPSGEVSRSDRGGSQQSPWSTRLDLLQKLEHAIDSTDKPAIESSVHQLLAARTREPLPLYQDGPLFLAVLEKLEAGPGVAPQLVRIVLRDGMQSRDGSFEGLERALVSRRGRLAKADFALLCSQISAVAQRHQVAVADFDARCQETSSLLPAVPPEEGHWLVSAGESQWYLESDHGEVRGVKVDQASLLRELETQLSARGLISKDDGLFFTPPARWDDADEATVSWQSTALDAERAAATTRYSLKLAVLLVMLLLTLALCAVAVVAQRRKLRFVELKSDFVSTVSHELRTPLASLRVMAETLQNRLDGVAEAKDYPKRIVEQSDALGFLVENILSFNRLDKGRWVAHRQPFALGLVPKWLHEDGANYLHAKVEQTFDGFDPIRLAADPDLMKLLFLNLLRNACKYNRNDPVKLEWRAREEPDRVEILVSDNGVGIPQSEWEAVFVEFHRLQGERGRGGGGAGLGLALCRKIAQMHEGTLRVRESSPAGTVFELRLAK
jgi:signal transduction histidine kinase